MNAARNIYKDDVDFSALALQSPDFAKYLKPNGQLDFSDPDAFMQLTQSLLKRDFGLVVSDLPQDRLCPPVPNRLNYILWLQDLLDTTGDEYSDDYDPDRAVKGLDIGTGCCAIYPLLGCATRPKWEFYATDIDAENNKSALHLVHKNNLDSRIDVLRTCPEDDLIPLDTRLGADRLDFAMCNPPFYASRDELISSAQFKQRPPFSACTGAEVEMVTPGGEVEFVSRMIDESLRLRQRVFWYTSMLGKLSSVFILIEKLIQCGNRNYAVTEFVQGSRTRRWAIAWSWTDVHLTVAVARGISGFPKHLLPHPSEYVFRVLSASVDDVVERLDTELTSLPMQWTWRQSLAAGVGYAMENVWSRQARRKMRNVKEEHFEPGIDRTKAALGFRVQVREEMEEEGIRVTIRWLKGEDSVLFESFCGMVKRKLEGR